MRQRHLRLALGGVVFICFLAIYWTSASPVATGYGDSDELLVTSFLGGVAHPPGYGLLTFLGGALMRLVSFWPPALVGNRLAALLMAAGMTGLFLAAGEILAHFTMRRSVRGGLALMVSGVIGLSFSMWTWGTIYEVGSATVAMTAWLLWSTVRWYRQANKKCWESATWYTTAALLGLGVGHYPLMLLLVPGLLWLWVSTLIGLHETYSKMARGMAKALMIIVAGFIVSLVPLWVQINRQIDVSWYAPVTIEGLVRHALLLDTQGYSFERQTEFAVFNKTLLDSPRALRAVTEYSLRLIDELGWWVVIVSFLGMGWIMGKDRKLGWMMWLGWGLTGPLLAWYIGPKPAFMGDYFAGIASRQFLLNYLFTGLGLALGLTAGWQVFLSAVQKRTDVPWWIGVVSLLAVGWQGYLNRSLLSDTHSRNVSARYAQAVLARVPKNAVIVCTTDVTCYALLYGTEVEKLRTDVTVLPHVSTYRVWYHKRAGDAFSLNQPNYLKAVVEHYVGQRPVFLTDGLGEYSDYIGWERGPYFLTPTGWGFEIVTEKPKAPLEGPASLFNTLKNAQIDERDLLRNGMAEIFSNTQAYAGYMSLMYGDAGVATQYLTSSLRLDPENAQAEDLLTHIDTYAETLKLEQP